MTNSDFGSDAEDTISACPDPHLLAAFVEGSLSSTDQKTVIRHLRTCDECHSVVVDFTRLRRELSPEVLNEEAEHLRDEPNRFSRLTGTSTKIPRQRKLRIAMLAAPVAAIFMFVTLLSGPPSWKSEDIFQALNNQQAVRIVGESFATSETGVFSLGFVKGISDQKFAYKVGIFVSQMEVLKRAGDYEGSKQAYQNLVNFFNGVVQKDSHLLTQLGVPKNASMSTNDEVDLFVDSIEGYFLTGPTEFYYKLGLVVETGRVFSLVNKSDLFDKEYLEILINDPEYQLLPPGIARRLGEFRDLLDKNSVAEKDQIIYNLLQDIRRILS